MPGTGPLVGCGSEVTRRAPRAERIPEETVANDEIVLAEGRHLRLVQRDGWEIAERVAAHDVVAILVVTEEGELVLVEQYRVPVGRRVVELPAGLVGDEGEGREAIDTAASRELEEEAGYEAAGFELLTEGPPSAGLTSEVVTFLRAIAPRRIGEGGGVGGEEIRVHHVPLVEVEAWLRKREEEGLLVDPKVWLGLWFASPPRP